MTTNISLMEDSVHLFRSRDKRGYQILINSAADHENASSKGKWLLCKNCRQQITTDDQRLAVNNSHIHTFTNPQDFTFRIGCFATAPGCVYMGVPTMQHTWFKGFSWRYAECSTCRTHLGWHFQKNSGENFPGLIQALLTGSE